MLSLHQLSNTFRSKIGLNSKKQEDLNSLQAKIKRGQIAEEFSQSEFWLSYLKPYLDNRPFQYANENLSIPRHELAEKSFEDKGSWREVNDLYNTLKQWVQEGKQSLYALEQLKKIQEDKNK